MFISKIQISNYRLFSKDNDFKIDEINVPDNANEGSGLNVFVGENASGKTSLLEAFALPMLEFKSDGFSIDDIDDPNEKVEIKIYSKEEFDVAGTMPKSSFKSKGFEFKASRRAKDSKSYLSSLIVTDQLFIKSDPNKPKDGSPDLRLSVNNPFAGRRFSENDIVVMDKGRLYQTRSGNYNPTRFDRLMEDFSHQYLKKSKDVMNLNADLDEKVKKDKVENAFLEKAIKKFHEISGIQVHLDFLDNYRPFKNAYFAQKKENNQQIQISNLGSGYEMIFALFYSFYMSQQGDKQLIILIDEPELHLHPTLQEEFVEFLLEISKDAQVFLTTHSPLLIKQLAYNDNVRTLILRDGQDVSAIADRKLSYISANETNFIAFNLATEEYHNELFEELKYINGDTKTIKAFDNDFFVTTKAEPKNSSWKRSANEVSEHTFIRNQIHHQKDNGKTEYQTLKASIEKMRTFF
jgi:predicted ATP-dependent endonuclease of OLD family